MFSWDWFYVAIFWYFDLFGVCFDWFCVCIFRNLLISVFRVGEFWLGLMLGLLCRGLLNLVFGFSFLGFADLFGCNLILFVLGLVF